MFLPNDPNASLGETANCRCSVRYVAETSDSIDPTLRVIAERRRLQKLHPKQHYKIKESVKLSASIVYKVGQIADEYYILTGKDIVVTSGVRSPAYQAQLMYDNRIKEGSFNKYRRSNALVKIEKIFNEGIEANKLRSQIIKEMEILIRNQVSRKVYVSLHLNERAFDVRSFGMSSHQKEAFRIAVVKFSGELIKEGNHWHIEF